MFKYTLAALGLLAGSAFAQSGKSMLGYYTNWAQYRPDPYKFFPDNIDLSLFTHLAYGFAIIYDGTYLIQPFEWNDIKDWAPDDGMYYRFNRFAHSKNPKIKTVLSIGGWNFSQDFKIFNNMASTAANRAAFVDSLISIARTYEFDGVDLDWEYPLAADRENFSSLLRDLNQKITEEAAASGKDRLYMAAAVSANHLTFNEMYDAKLLGELCDWVSLMTYDLYGAWETTTRAHTQLYPLDPSDPNEMAVSRSVEAWAKYVPVSKLLMGLAAYGKSTELVDKSQVTSEPCNFLAKSKDYTGWEFPGPRSPIINAEGSEGTLAYWEVQYLLSKGAKECVDLEKTFTAVLQDSTYWAAYDNIQTLKYKTDFAKAKNLMGVMWWALDLDLFNDGYPLMSFAAAEMGIIGSSGTPVTTPVAVTTTTPAAVTTTTPAAVTTTTPAAVTTAPAVTTSASSGLGCKSKVNHISDEWCAKNMCEKSFPTFCEAV